MKRLAVFLDGTWNDPASRTNVSRLHGLVADVGTDGARQLAYYDTGVGTKRFEKLRGGVGAYGLSRNVRQAYGWLKEQYEEGDEVFVFGFSRGAFTARSVAGMIARYGLLMPDSSVTVDELYELYRAEAKGKPGPGSVEEALVSRLKENARRIRVRFVGVWDTVGTLGVPFGNIPGISRKQFRFHNTRPSRWIDEGCQALAINENRRAYDAVLWTNFLALNPATGKIADPLRRSQVHHPSFEQRWFIGVHSNVGGGYPDDVLALPPLSWIQRRAAGAGLAFTATVALSGDEHLRGELVDSFKRFMKGIYQIVRFNRRHYREIGRALVERSGRSVGLLETVNESIDRTVIERWQQDGEYRPKNLREFADRAGIDLEAPAPADSLKVESDWDSHT